MADYSLSKNVAGSLQDNNQTRNINSFFPYTAGTYKTISLITRRDGIWCSCGGTSQSVTMDVYDQMLDGSIIIKQSDTVSCKCYGTGPSSDNYAKTTFDNWTQAESNAAIAAWEAGTLIIKRFVTITSYTSSGHGSPTFRDGYYNDDIVIQGSTVPFTQYLPTITSFSVMRSNDGVDENPESETIYARLNINMNDATGLTDAPILRLYYSPDITITESTSYLELNDLFGMTAENLGVEKVFALPNTWSNGMDWYFKLHFSAGYEEALDATASVSRTSVPLFLASNNKGVSIGQYSTATESQPKFESGWAFFANGGIEGVTNFTTNEVKTGGTWIDGKPIYRKVFVQNVNATSTWCRSSDEDAITDVDTIIYGTVMAQGTRRANFTGLYWSSSNYIRTFYERDEDVQSTVRLLYWANNAEHLGTVIGIVYYTKLVEGEVPAIRVSRPSAAMTANSSQSCVASASATYSSSYPAYKAFDKSYSDQYGWSAPRGTTSAWIQLKMDIALSNIEVTLANRTYNYSNGPTQGEILCSSDGSTWVSMTTFTGRNGNTGATPTVHKCNNETPYQYVRVLCERPGGDLVSIGEVFITGEKAV